MLSLGPGSKSLVAMDSIICPYMATSKMILSMVTIYLLPVPIDDMVVSFVHSLPKVEIINNLCTTSVRER